MVSYEELGVRRVINAATTFTAIGGSLMPPEVLDAMRAAAGSFVDLHELQRKAGEELARMTGNEAAFVTAGCAAAIVLTVLGARTGADPAAIQRLIDAGPGEAQGPDEVIIHAAHRIPYDPAVALAGARLRVVGDVLQTFPWQLEAAISERTAAVLYVAGDHLPKGALPLDRVVDIAHANGIPVIVDCAAQLPPVENLWRFTRDSGADAALFSGGKALRGPQASGLVVGSTALVEAARAHAAPHQRLARAMKVGKEELMGLTAAVRRYVHHDHDADRARWYRIVDGWAEDLSGIVGVECVVEHRNEAGQPVPRLRIDLVEGPLRDAGEVVVAHLRSGDPRVEVLANGDRGFWIGPDLVTDDEVVLVERAVRAALGAVGTSR